MLCFIDAGSFIVLVGLDILATFDTVNYNILLRRLEQDFVISGNPLRWLASYLSSRSFCVYLSTSSSSYAMTSTDMSQGSGPLPFTFYVVPICLLIKSYGIKYYKYANDTHLHASLTVPPDSSLHSFENCTTGLQYWFWSNDLLLNPDKSEVCFFSTRRRLQHSNRPASITVALHWLPIYNRIFFKVTMMCFKAL